MSEGKKLYKSLDDKIICGLCGGLGEYFNIDPTIVRILFVLFFIINPVAATLFYILACAIIPKKPAGPSERIKPTAKRVTQREQGLIIVGLMLILAGVLVFPEIKFILRSALGGLAVALGLLIILLVLFKKKH